MKKIININFHSRVIPIEESAYDILKQYILNSGAEAKLIQLTSSINTISISTSTSNSNIIVKFEK